NGKLLIVTSTLTLSEVLCIPEGIAEREKALAEFEAFFDHDWIEVRPVDRLTAEIGATIRSDHSSLKIPDAIHVATCLRWRIKYLHTYDADHLLNKDGLIETPPLRVIKPCYPEDHPLFDGTPDEPTVLKFERKDDEPDLEDREPAASD